MSSKPFDAVVAGYLGVDIAPGFANREAASFAEIIRPGKLVEMEGVHFSLGGVVANTGLAMKRFGCAVELMGCVGNDVLGKIAMAKLAEAGVTRGIRCVSSAGTAYGIVLAPSGLDRVFLEDPGCNRVFTAADINFDVVRQSRLFHFGYPPLMEALWKDEGRDLSDLLKQVRACGTAVSLDMTLPDAEAPAGKADWEAILSSTLPLVDIFAPSIEELLFMLEPTRYADIAAQAADADMIDVIPVADYERISCKVLAMGVKVLLIKAGHKGAYLRTGNLAALGSSALQLTDDNGCPDGVWLSALGTDAGQVCNTSGAGDCAIAGFLAGLLKDEGVLTAGRLAMVAGRDNLYGQDALSGLREWGYMLMEDGVREHGASS